MLDDPAWIGKFLAVGNQKLSGTFGFTPTIWGFTNAICHNLPNCTILVSSAFILVITAISIYWILINPFFKSFVWALCVITPLAVMLTPYLWAYDQILLLLPITMITIELWRRGYRYILVALIPFAIAIISIALLVAAMNFGNDGLSFLVPLICLLVVFWLAATARRERDGSRFPTLQGENEHQVASE